MAEHEIRNEDIEDPSIDSVRRKLLKIGIYAVPAIMFLGRVNEARASGPNGPPFDPPGPPTCIPPVRNCD